VPDDLHDLLKALRKRYQANLTPHDATTDAERLLTAVVLKLADEVAELRSRLRRVV